MNAVSNPASRSASPTAANEFHLPADGWIHLTPIGEYPHPSTGLSQLIDVRSICAMANRFASDASKPYFPGLLVDFDHFAFDPSKSSAAAGWITEVQSRDNGLWGKVRWTLSGKSAIADGTYRFISPVFYPGETEAVGKNRVRPLRLAAAGLTNNPNLRGMQPISNRHTETPDSARDAVCYAILGGRLSATDESAHKTWFNAILNRSSSVALLNTAPVVCVRQTDLFTAAFKAAVASGMTKSQAVDAVIAKNPQAHQDWIRNGGGHL